MRTPLVAGNWKMNKTVAEAGELVSTMKPKLQEIANVEKVLCPPYLAIPLLSEMLKGSGIGLGAQNLYWEQKGAFTGEIAPGMVREFCDYVIIGHSERREYHAESDEVVASKVQAAIRNGLVPVICVGETAEDLEKHGASAVPVGQLQKALEGLPAGTEIVVAYEPVWAIGSGQAATPDQAQDVCAKLRDVVAGALGAEAAAATRILYGGSVKAANIASFMREPDVDGALVGGASLLVDEFAAIVRYQKHVGV